MLEDRPPMKSLDAKFLDAKEARKRYPGNEFAPGVVIEETVRIGQNNELFPGVFIQGRTNIGNSNRIMTGAAIGGRSRESFGSSKPPHSSSAVNIGDQNIIFEYVTIHAPLLRNTAIGSQNAIGAHSHVAHDATIDDYTILAPHTSIGGYAYIGARANLGLAVAVQPRLAVGGLAMCGTGAVLRDHVLPCATVAGVPAHFIGTNVVGLRRAAWSDDEIAETEMLLHSGRICFATPNQRVFVLVKDFLGQLQQWSRHTRTLPDVPIPDDLLASSGLKR
jgi:UDP-N-acetylglucosamine acyltransferase